MFRGIERCSIFLDDEDRNYLLDRLNRVVPESGMTCLAWALMPNHAHLLVRTGQTPLSRVMSRVGTGYAGWFNHRYDRVGHLFQNRFKSVLVRSDEQLIVTQLYIHLNPLKAEIVNGVDDLARYPWSGFAGLMGRHRQPFHAVEQVLRLYGDDPRRARVRLYRAMLRHRGDADIQLDEAAGGDAVLLAVGTTPARDSVGAAGFGLLMREVCDRRQIRCEHLVGNRKFGELVRARSEVAYRASSELGMANSEIAKRLGVSESCASKAVRRGRELSDA